MAESTTVLVFGATGNVGRHAALAAQSRGAKVYLASRDPTKHIAGISNDSFPRVAADLTKAESISAAVEQSGAKRALVYMVDYEGKGMKSTFEALRDAGIEYVVFLSSQTVKGVTIEALEPQAKQEDNVIHSSHAAAELELERSGLRYTSVRPGMFSTNLLWEKNGILGGKVQLYLPKALFDWIAPEDVGAVCGALLAKPSTSKTIHVSGADVLSFDEAIAIIGKIFDRDIHVEELDAEEFQKVRSYIPAAALRSQIRLFRHNLPGPNGAPKGLIELFKEGASNVREISGQEPMGLAAWVEKHKEELSG